MTEASKELCARALMQLETAIVVRDPDHRIVACSRAAARLGGFTPERLVGTREDPFAGYDGRTTASVTLPDGRAIGTIETLEGDPRATGDMAAALYASESRFRRLIEANVIGVGIVNGDGLWLEANDELLRIICRSRAELTAGQIDGEVIVPEHRPAQAAARAEARRAGAQRPCPSEFMRPDGSTVPVVVGYATVTGVENHYVAFVLDLTAQRQVEDALREADRRKDEFLAMLAHELRNPLAPMVTALHLMSRADASPPLILRARSTLERQMTMLIRLVDDLLDVSRLVRGAIELRLEQTSVQAIVQRALEMSGPLLQSHGHRVVVQMPDAPVALLADPLRLAQVVSNLLNNAAKYTPAGGRIAVTVSPGKDAVSLVVEDTGIGIPGDRLQHVFELFAQVDPTLDRARGGLGIGLTVVKRLVELHHGSVSATSDGAGQGSTFTVTLPRSDAAVATARTPAAGADVPPARRLRILVVDDNVDAADTLSAFLRLEGHDVHVVHDSTAALARAAAGFDVALLDVGLPVMNGYELARRLRAQYDGSSPTLVALTGYGQTRDRELSAAAGFAHHLVKPVDLNRLRELLDRLPHTGSGTPHPRPHL